MQLLGNRVVIQKIYKEPVTQSGILLKKEHEEQPNLGRVMEVSGNVKLFKVGDVVVFEPYSGTEFDLPEYGGKVTVLAAENVIAVVDLE